MLLLILDQLFWSMVVPLVSLVAWLLVRPLLILAAPIRGTMRAPVWAETPWDLHARWCARPLAARLSH
jgi:hypothetical protein